MLHEQALKLATGLASRKVIDENALDVYTYGFELILSALINVIIMAIISILFRRYYDWLLFLAAFIPLRMTAGGYHAKTHLMCIVVGTVSFSFFLTICRLQIPWTVIIVIAVTSFLSILLFAPVEAYNKKLKEKQRRKNRSISFCMSIANLLIAIVLSSIVFSDFVSIYYSGVFAAALSMLVGKIKK